jgi:hypothetical protein
MPPREHSIPAPAPTNPGSVDADSIQRMIDERIAAVESRYDKKIKALEKRHADEMRAARGVPPVDSAVPTHAGGPGDTIAQTWSQYHQELSRAGLLTDTHIRQANGLVPLDDDDDDAEEIPDE